MQKALRNTLIGAGTLAAAITANAILNTSSAVYNAGTGSGNLVIDGNVTKYPHGSTIKIKGGSYSTITIQNLSGTTDSMITITTDGTQVALAANNNNTIPVNLSLVQNVIIDGQTSAGFYIHDLSYRGMQVHGNPTGLIIKHFLFQNISDYSIGFDYNDTYPAVASNVQVTDCEFNNAGSISFQGNVNDSLITGYLTGLVIDSCYFHDNPGVGTIAYCGNCDSYNIHDNVVKNINQNNNNHNGIFMMDGNGAFYNNKVTNHQGNAIRAWAFTVGTTPKKVLIYNNLVDSSRKYSGFEVQSFQYYVYKNLTTYANAQIYNNTCGDLNLTHDWVGGVVDVYNLFGGTCAVTNNLCWNSYPANTITNQQSTLVPTVSGNVYQPTWKTAVTDLTTYKSLFPGVGATLTNTTTTITPPATTTSTNPPPTTLYDTIYIHDTVTLAGKSTGTYTLTVSQDTLTIKKQ